MASTNSAAVQSVLAALVENTPHLGYRYDSDDLLLEADECEILVANFPQPITERICAELTGDPAYFATRGKGRRILAGVIEAYCWRVIRGATDHAGEMRAKAFKALEHAAGARRKMVKVRELADEARARANAVEKGALEASRRSVEADESRAEALERTFKEDARAREAWRLVDAAEWPADNVRSSAEEAEARATEAKRHLEEAKACAIEALRTANEARRCASAAAIPAIEAQTLAVEAEGPSKEAWKRSTVLWNEANEAQRHNEEVRTRLNGILARTRAIATSNEVVKPLLIDEWLKDVSDPIAETEGTACLLT